jgi:Indole-3-glycerol phosphate synthase
MQHQAAPYAGCVPVAVAAGLADLFAVSQAVDAPVLMRDWILHPLQIVDAREAGAAGVLGIVTSVSADGTGDAPCTASTSVTRRSQLLALCYWADPGAAGAAAVLSSFASALGLEAPAEVSLSAVCPVAASM